MRGARRYQDLIVWQLADQVRVLVFKLTERERFARDFKLHSQTEDAVNSVCRNIAEGFGCKHKEFARFLEISRRSLNELGDSFRTAQLKRYVSAHDYEPIWRLTHRLYPAFARLIRYLQTTPDPDFTDRDVFAKYAPTRSHVAPTRSHIAPTRSHIAPNRSHIAPPLTELAPVRVPAATKPERHYRPRLSIRVYATASRVHLLRTDPLWRRLRRRLVSRL
jgi:four helix bundle protein